ncbi:MAG: 4Fe-4S binding protein, partial [Pirellulales bacterium]
MSRWRAASLLAVYVLIGLHLLHWKLYGRTLAPVEPSETFDTLHLGIITVGFLFMLGAVLATSVAGRFFCGWGCHILALQDLCAWILRSLKIPTRPIRSRTLLWVPPLAALYLFVWPQVQRLLAGESLPALQVVTDPDGWTSFTTTDLLRSFPGVGMTLFTFAICGFVMIYFLGSRSFCNYACPYGAIFAAAEQVAPLRIVAGPGECSQCGLCIANCKSSVRVIEEVKQFGAVIDVNCMKDLDCVSVCPTGALRYGATRPPLFFGQAASRKLKKPYDFSLGEDLFMGGVFVVVLPILRGLYDAIAFLLALALAAIISYFAVIALRLLRNSSVSIGQLVLKHADHLTLPGRVFAAGSAVLLMFLVQSGFV